MDRLFRFLAFILCLTAPLNSYGFSSFELFPKFDTPASILAKAWLTQPSRPLHETAILCPTSTEKTSSTQSASSSSVGSPSPTPTIVLSHNPPPQVTQNTGDGNEPPEPPSDYDNTDKPGGTECLPVIPPTMSPHFFEVAQIVMPIHQEDHLKTIANGIYFPLEHTTDQVVMIEVRLVYTTVNGIANAYPFIRFLPLKPSVQPFAPDSAIAFFNTPFPSSPPEVSQDLVIQLTARSFQGTRVLRADTSYTNFVEPLKVGTKTISTGYAPLGVAPVGASHYLAAPLHSENHPSITNPERSLLTMAQEALNCGDCMSYLDGRASAIQWERDLTNVINQSSISHIVFDVIIRYRESFRFEYR